MTIRLPIHYILGISGAILCLIYHFCLLKFSIFILLQLFFLVLHFFIQQLGLVDASCCSWGQMGKCHVHMQPPLVTFPLHLSGSAVVLTTSSDSLLFLPTSLLCCPQRSHVAAAVRTLRLAKTYGGDFLRVFKIQISMYFLPGDSLLVNSERVYRCTCYCIYLIKKRRTIGAQLLTFFLWELNLLQVPHVRSIGIVQYAISNLTQVFWIKH